MELLNKGLQYNPGNEGKISFVLLLVDTEVAIENGKEDEILKASRRRSKKTNDIYKGRQGKHHDHSDIEKSRLCA